MSKDGPNQHTNVEAFAASAFLLNADRDNSYARWTITKERSSRL